MGFSFSCTTSVVTNIMFESAKKDRRKNPTETRDSLCNALWGKKAGFPVSDLCFQVFSSSLLQFVWKNEKRRTRGEEPMRENNNQSRLTSTSDSKVQSLWTSRQVNSHKFFCWTVLLPVQGESFLKFAMFISPLSVCCSGKEQEVSGGRFRRETIRGAVNVKG
jgi:hypothetical protein